MGYFNRHFFLISFIFLSTFLSFQINNGKFQSLGGESGIIEITQNITLLFTIFINLRCRKKFIKLGNKFVTNIRILIFFFIFYEEISFITYNPSSPLNFNNAQLEFNIHNLNIFYTGIDNLPIFIENIHLNTIFELVFLLFFAYGKFLKPLEKFKFLFLENRYSFYIMFYISDLIISSFIRFYGFLGENFVNLISSEMTESYIYLLFLFDSIDKLYFKTK